MRISIASIILQVTSPDVESPTVCCCCLALVLNSFKKKTSKLECSSVSDSSSGGVCFLSLDLPGFQNHKATNKVGVACAFMHASDKEVLSV